MSTIPQMNPNSQRLAATAILILAGMSAGLAEAAPVRAEHVEAELIAENQAFVAGATDNWIALRLRPDPGWHVYWQNPGDSGIPTKLVWSLPEGVSAGAIHWPYPHEESLGELTNYGYGEETLHLVAVHVASTWPQTQPVPLKAEAKWLVCSDVCIPGSAQLTLDMPLAASTTPDPDWAPDFAKARAQLPQVHRGWVAHYAVSKTEFSLAIEGAGLGEARKIEFFPLAPDLVNHAAPQRVALDARGLRLSQTLNTYFIEAANPLRGVLVVHEDQQTRAWDISAEPGAVEAVPAVAAAAAKPAATTVALPPSESLLLILLFAIAGGLILNLMPCVFPVLSLKAIAVMESRAEDHAGHRAHALAYTAGVILSCVTVAGVLLALRASGAAIGWGFQLQSPAFVALLVYLLFAMGLSLSGLVQFGTRLMGVGQNLTEIGGYGSSFFTGVLATVVASPCSAPFMGTALGYALTQSAPVALLVFAMLGLGLALPFLLLGIFPRLAALLPRPGAWMETFKQVMAFPLYLSVVWLLWVISRQADANAAALVMVGLVLIAFALWLWHRPGRLALALKLVAIAAALALLADPMLAPAAGKPVAMADAQSTEPWSEARVAELRAQGRTVFVDFTADWCLSCKVNERVALGAQRVRDAFAQHNVAYLVGDWTSADPAITRLLQSFGRSGVPLYLVYRDGGEPEVLPQLLTPDVVIDAIK